MRRLIKVSALALGVVLLLVVVLGGAVMVAGNTDSGRAFIERMTFRLSAGTVKLSGLAGSFPTQLSLGELQLIDRGGVWLTADRIALRWSPLRLLERRIHVDTLQVERLHIERAPVGDGGGGSSSIPHVDVLQLSLEKVELGAPLVGTAATVSVRGNVRLRSLQNAQVDAVVHRLDGDGDYTLHLLFDPKKMAASLVLHEPAGGPLETLLSLPGLGALSATMTVKGPRDAEVVDLALRAGDLHALAQGRVDLTHSAADLNYSLDAPAMAPRPDVAWAGIALRGNWHGSLSAPHADGRLEVGGLRIAGGTQIAKLTANLAAGAGKVTLHGSVVGLEIPGPQPRFFAGNPLKIEASLLLNEASRPLDFTLTHPLLSLRGRASTDAGKAGQLGAAVELKVPELAPFAALTGQDVRGNARINAHIAHGQSNDSLTLDANLGLTGGTAGWLGFVGPRVTVQFSGGLSADSVQVDSLRIAARVVTLAGSGNARRAMPAPGGGTTADTRGAAARFVRDLQARWQLEISDLTAMSGDVGGDLKMSGRLSGAPTAMAGDVDLTSRLSVRGSASGTVAASIHARGLPGAPSGTVQAHGMVDGAPLTLDAAIERSGGDALRLLIRQADWKSAHVDGDLTADAALTKSHGQLRMRIAQLGDLNRLLGVSLSGGAEGSLGFIPSGGKTEAQLSVDGKELIVGQVAGNVHLRAAGVANALQLQMNADLPNLHGMPANLSSAAELNMDTRELRLESAALDYHGETVRLLAPALLSFGKGFFIDDLKLGVQEAVFEVQGQLAPLLDLRTSLRQIKPGLINVFSPGLLAGGTIEAQARLQGSLSSITGLVRLDANDIRSADDAATGLPGLDLHARAELAGDAATVDATLSVGTDSKLTASGILPLYGDRALDMKIGGTLAVGVANPFLEARGMHATGQLTADATVTGSLAAPQVGGGITLSKGSLRDYGRGVNLSDITAEVVGREGALQIKSFKATAGSGSVGMTGTFGVLQPRWPVDLNITARNAQPIASSILTANMDADLHVSGTARQRLDVVGTIHVNRATIGIPNSLPPDVAVLDVRRRGKTVQVDAAKQLIIGMDVVLQAPQQILVQGRGLDAEMGGEIHLSGTTDALLASGGFDLQRGSFTLAGSKLTFTQGRVGFDGAGLRKKIDPTLDFTAQTTLSATTATLHITGVADAPRFEFSSSPPLPQDEIMAQLLFGENAAQLTALQAAQIGAALATLSGVGGGGLNPLVRLQKSLGLDRLTVGANTTNTATGSQSSGAAIAAGRYISKRVYIEGKQTTTGTSQVQVDVDLTKHLKLQTRLGNGSAITQGTTPENDPGSSIGLSYQFEY